MTAVDPGSFFVIETNETACFVEELVSGKSYVAEFYLRVLRGENNAVISCVVFVNSGLTDIELAIRDFEDASYSRRFEFNGKYRYKRATVKLNFRFRRHSPPHGIGVFNILERHSVEFAVFERCFFE